MTDTLLRDHAQMLLKWSRENAYGAPPCFECKAETEHWWSYCAMCGYHIAGAGNR